MTFGIRLPVLRQAAVVAGQFKSQGRMTSRDHVMIHVVLPRSDMAGRTHLSANEQILREPHPQLAHIVFSYAALIMSGQPPLRGTMARFTADPARLKIPGRDAS